MCESHWAVRHLHLEVWSAHRPLKRGRVASIPYCTANGDNSGLSYSSPSAPEVHLIKKETKRLCVPNASLIYCIKNPICPHNRLRREEAVEIQEAFKLAALPPAPHRCRSLWSQAWPA